MEPAHYTDPLEEALSHGSQRVAQFASLAAAMAQVVIQRRTLEQARKAVVGDQRARRVLDDQERMLQRQARLSWAPAHDAQWLAQAGFTETARAWAGAAAYADTDPAAAAALRKCEDKLRALHPYAMARYDRLRHDGMTPLDAMRETAPLFARAPDARVGDPVPARFAVGADASPDLRTMGDEVPREHPESDPGEVEREAAELRGQEMIERIQARAVAADRPTLGTDELAMILEAVTNLPEEVIDKLTRQAATETGTRSAERRSTLAGVAGVDDLDQRIDPAAVPRTGERSAGLTSARHDSGFADTGQASADRSPAQLAAENFPVTVADGVKAAATGPRGSALAPVRVAAPNIAKRSGPRA